MTEAEWLACGDRQPMLEPFRGKFSNRKLRLFACACCRRIWHRLADDSREAVVVAERFADGEADQEELRQAEGRAVDVTQNSDGEAAWFATYPDAWLAAFDASYAAAGREVILGWPGRNDHDDERFAREHAASADLLRDIFGNPYRSPAVESRWLASTVVSLTVAIYADRAFDRMPLLADALEDAGCDNADILAHCRGEGPHVRGCWVVDLVLGKS
jgi:hypothetical protein